MRKLFLTLSFCLFMINSNAQEVFKLWTDNPKTFNGLSGEEEWEGNGRVSNITDPDITIYHPDKEIDKNAAIIICPGGGYARLAIEHEGHEFAKWLKKNGYTAVVLKYRMPNKHKEVPLDDLQQAMHYVRSKSDEWDIQKVGVAGFSAGGHLASTSSTHFEDQLVRPDFSILFYPVISMGEFTHPGSKNNLLGEDASEKDIINFSNEKQVTMNTPPTILLLSDDDKSVPPINSTMYYEALKRNNIPASMYIFPVGGHGWGMRENFKYHNEMKALLLSWLDETI